MAAAPKAPPLLHRCCTGARSPDAVGYEAGVAVMGELKKLLRDRSFNDLASGLRKRDRGLRERFEELRSLGNRLARLDKGDDPTLLKDWPQVPELIAAELGIEVAVVQRCVNQAQAGKAPHVFVVDDLAGEVALDLLKDDLFPGVPDVVRTPKCWNRVWWAATSGAGKKVAGAWLGARGLAAVRPTRSWTDLVLDEDDPRPTYVVLEQKDDRARPVRERMCVAAPFLPPRPAEWTVLTTPPLEAWLDALISWVGARLPADGGFDPVAVKRFIEKAGDVFETPGHVLGVCGLVFRYGSKRLDPRDINGLAKAFMELGAERAHLPPDRGRALERHAGEILRSLCAGTMCKLDHDPRDGMSLDEVEALLPASVARKPDLEGARALVKKRKTEKDREALLSKVEERLGPAVAADLVEVRLLEPVAEGCRVRPWLERLGVQSVVEQLVTGGGASLGEALLRAHAAPLALARLLDVFRSGNAQPLEAAIDRLQANPEDPGAVASFEGCFRAAGIATLCRVELPKALLNRAWECQFTIAVRKYAGVPPLPLLDWTSDDPWLHQGTWVLACLAIAERVGATNPTELAVWTGAPSTDALNWALHQASWAAWEHPIRPPWWAEAFDLGRRLIERRVIPELSAQMPALLVPGAVVLSVRDAAQLPEGVDVRSAVQAADAIFPADIDVRWVLHRTARSWLDPFRDQARRVGVSFERVIANLWTAWAAKADKGSGLRFDSLVENDQRDIWRCAPAELFAKPPLFEAILGWRGIPRRFLTHEQWRAFLSAWDVAQHGHLDMTGDRAAAWWEMPKELLIEMIRTGRLADHRARDIWAIAWERVAEEFMDNVRSQVDEGRFEAAGVPDSRRPELLGNFVARCAQGLASGEQLRLARFWFHDYVARRLPRWREAFAALRALPSQPTAAPQGKRPRKP